MADALLAGFPRIARASEEIRLRGMLALALALSAASWWAIQWRLDQPVQSGRTWLLALIVAVLGGFAGAANVVRRIRQGLLTSRSPNARVVYETRAEGKARRTRLSGALFLTAMVVLVVDSLAGWGGATAGVLTGAALAAGIADLVEARRWRQAERTRESELYVLVAANALVATYGQVQLFEISADVGSRQRDAGPFSL